MTFCVCVCVCVHLQMNCSCQRKVNYSLLVQYVLSFKKCTKFLHLNFEPLDKRVILLFWINILSFFPVLCVCLGFASFIPFFNLFSRCSISLVYSLIIPGPLPLLRFVLQFFSLPSLLLHLFLPPTSPSPRTVDSVIISV